MLEKAVVDTIAGAVGASHTADFFVAFFVPSHDEHDERIDQKLFVNKALHHFGMHLGGATAFPRARGVWRDDAQAGKLKFDRPVVLHSFTTEEQFMKTLARFRQLVLEVLHDARQRAVGFVVGDYYLEVRASDVAKMGK